MNIDWAQHLLFDEVLLEVSDSPMGEKERKKEKKKSPPCLPEMFGAILGDPWVAGLR